MNHYRAQKKKFLENAWPSCRLPSGRIRVLIADNHPLFRRGLHGLLDLVTGIEVVGEATEEGCLLYSASILEDG